MINRILDMSDSPGHVSVWNGLMRLERKDAPEITIPFEEVAVVVGAHRQLTFTQAFFARLAESGGVFIACNEKSKPMSMMLPIEGHHLQAEQFSLQAQASLPVKKRAWQSIVKAKIRAQAHTLQELHGSDYGIGKMAERVRSGDPDNMEGQAARRYWPRLFSDEPKFKRDRTAAGRNAMLNFGYTILRAITARAVCAAGLHPSLGVHHHNRYDAFVLADDLMEPFRPIVDYAVAVYRPEADGEITLEKNAKRALYEALYAPRMLQGEQRSLFNVQTRICASLVKVFRGERKTILTPE